jgi:1,4-dihydroxy-2-naphthoate octaprenyltransferase
LRNPFLRYFAATRPAFLSVTFVGCLLGLATATLDGITPHPLTATLTVLFALVAHAGVNVLNDYYDAQSGTDALNSERVFPFTGGSRFIQNQVMSARATGILGYALLASVIPAGLWLAYSSAPELILIGLAGLLLGWAYSAPPLQLVSRGLGEGAVAGAWCLIVVGTDFVQRGGFAFTPLAAGLGFALLVSTVLYINQFPDARADAQAGKRTLVVRLGADRARWGYLMHVIVAYAWVTLCVASGSLPVLAVVSLLTLPLSLAATRLLWRLAYTPNQLAPAIKLTILSAVVHGLLLAIALVIA